MRKRYLFYSMITIWLCLCGLAFAGTGYAWVARYSGPAFYGTDIPNDIAVDAEGNVYVTGSSDGGATGYDYATVKYDANGNQLWVQRYTNGITGPYSEAASESANALVLDKEGNAYITGSSGSDYVTIKYDKNGNQLWLVKYDSAGGRDGDRASDIAIDASGNVYVTGGSWYSNNAQPYYYATVKYDNNGNQLWVRREPSNWDYYRPFLTTDNEGNVYVAGTSAGSYMLVKYDTNGNKIWERMYGAGIATGFATDNSGNLYITGISSGGYPYIYHYQI